MREPTVEVPEVRELPCTEKNEAGVVEPMPRLPNEDVRVEVADPVPRLNVPPADERVEVI